MGKGTQAQRLSKEYNVPHIATGDILRQSVKNGTEIGLKAKSYMDKGLLVPDDVVIGIIESRLAQPDVKAGYILDGFPRTVPQAQALDDLITRMDMVPDAVVNINASVDMVVRRLTGRRTCRDCQAVYHVVNIQPKKAGVCDRCGGKLYQRDDDTEETIRKRIQVYMEQTAPLIDYYQESGRLTGVSGDIGLDKVYASICDSLP